MNSRRFIFIALWLVVPACAVSPRVTNEESPDASGAKPGLYSQEGMTNAVLQIEAALGSDDIKPIAAGYERAYRLDPKNPYKRFLWAYTLEDRNEACSELTKITKLDDRFYWAYLGMGIILDGWKVYDQAEKNFQIAISLGPNIAIGADRFGRMCLHKGDPAKALPLLAAAVKQDPKSAEYLLDLARAQRDSGHTSEAISTYRDLLQRFPTLFAGHAELADLLLKNGDKAGALEEYQSAAALNDRSFEVCRGRAALLLEQGRIEEAADAYQTACQLKPTAVECWRTLAGLAAKLGKRDLQVSAFEQAIKVDYNDLEAHRFLAATYLQAGEIEKALPSFQQLHAKLPDDTDALLGLGEIYERGEEPSKALEFYERLLVLRPDLDKVKAARNRLFERFSILTNPISGNNPQQISAKNQEQINKVFKMRLKERPGLQGELVLEVKVNNLGQVEDVFLSKDTVADPVIGTSAVWNLKRARFPKNMGATYNFSLSLKPAKRE
jgi:tetratricopeptide (TPR) repeat protein